MTECDTVGLPKVLKGFYLISEYLGYIYRVFVHPENLSMIIIIIIVWGYLGYLRGLTCIVFDF